MKNFLAWLAWSPFVLAGIFLHCSVHGQCITLPVVELQGIDRYTDVDPNRAIAEARTLLSAPEHAHDAFFQAQLYAIIADASILISQPLNARGATMAGIALLLKIPETAMTRRVKQRLRIAASTADMGSTDSIAAVKTLNLLALEVPEDSLERSCLLQTRGEAYSELDKNDQAAADAIESYRIAADGGWLNARMQAAYVLATIYGRAGLTGNALALIDEVESVAEREGKTQVLAMASFSRGKILIEARRLSEALAALEITRHESEILRDPVGVASANFATCMILVEQKNVQEADRRCRAHDKEFAGAHRTDLLIGMRGVLAQLALLHGRPKQALALLDSILKKPSRNLVPYLLPSLFTYRATALSKLGRPREGYDDLKEAARLEQAAGSVRQVQEVAILRASAEQDKLISKNHSLRLEVQRQQEDMTNQRYVRRLWIGFLAIAVLLSMILSHLLALAKRQGKALRKHEATLLAYADNAPDAIVLLDEHGLVRFANRHLLGEAQCSHTVGEPLLRTLSASAQLIFVTAIEDLLVKGVAIDRVVTVIADDGRTRYLSLRGRPLHDNGHLAGATVRSIDITEVRILEREVVDAASRERQRLSSDIHEGMGQVLTGVLLLIRSLMKNIDRGKAVSAAAVAEIHEHVAHTLTVARGIALGLSPLVVERRSLHAALTRLSQDSSQRFNMEVSYESEGVDSLPDIADEYVYQIASEAVTNAARHAECSKITISLTVKEDALDLAITDDGKGIPRDAPITGLGLKLMAYHSRLMGGRLQIQPGPTSGTQVSLNVRRNRATDYKGTQGLGVEPCSL